MPAPERAAGQAGDGPIGEDLRAAEIEHWQIHDHPDRRVILCAASKKKTLSGVVSR